NLAPPGSRERDLETALPRRRDPGEKKFIVTKCSVFCIHRRRVFLAVPWLHSDGLTTKDEKVTKDSKLFTGETRRGRGVENYYSSKRKVAKFAGKDHNSQEPLRLCRIRCFFLGNGRL